jgi:hypothetical protein
MADCRRPGAVLTAQVLFSLFALPENWYAGQ